MKPQLGLSCSIFGCRPPVEDDFRQFREFGIKYMEASLLRGWDEPDLDRIVAQICRWSEKYDIVVNSVHGPSGAPPHDHWLADPDEAERQKNIQERRKVLNAARQIGAKYLITEYECCGWWPFWPHDLPAVTLFPKAKELWHRSLSDLLEDAARTGVRLAIENIDGLPCADVAEALTHYDPNLVGICFDSSHALYGPGIFEELGHLIPRLIGTHLSDNDGLEGRQFVDRHWFPFQGTIDWNRLMKTLVTATPCPVFIVEVLSPEKRITPGLVDSLHKLRDLIEENIPGRNFMEK
jgi:sugar phosphate isomerase/epimerase